MGFVEISSVYERIKTLAWDSIENSRKWTHKNSNRNSRSPLLLTGAIFLDLNKSPIQTVFQVQVSNKNKKKKKETGGDFS